MGKKKAMPYWRQEQSRIEGIKKVAEMLSAGQAPSFAGQTALGSGGLNKAATSRRAKTRVSNPGDKQGKPLPPPIKKTTSTPQRPQPYAEHYGISQLTTPPYAPGLEAQQLPSWGDKSGGKKAEQHIEQVPQTEPDSLAFLSAEELEKEHSKLLKEREVLQRNRKPYLETAGASHTTVPYAAGPCGVQQKEQQKEQISQLKDNKELERINKDIKRYAQQYADTAGRELWKKLQADKDTLALYTTARELEADLNKTQRVIEDPNGNAYAAGAGMNPSYQRELTKKYGVNDMGLLGGRLRSSLDETRKAIERAGYDYQRLSDYDHMLTAKKRHERMTEKWKQDAEDHPMWASAGTVMAAPFQGIDFAKAFLDGIGKSNPTDLKSYRNPNVYDMTVTNMVSTVRETVSEEIRENTDWEVFGKNVWEFLYDSGMNAADAVSLAYAAGPAAPVFMGAASASKQAKSVIERGGSYDQAFWGGLSVGAAETALGMSEIGDLLGEKTAKGWMSILKKGTVTAKGIDGLSDGALVEISKILSDAAIMAEKSEYANSVRRYMREQDMTEEQAREQAFLDCVGQVAWSSTNSAIESVMKK